MKKSRKYLALLLAALMAFSSSVAAFAVEDTVVDETAVEAETDAVIEDADTEVEVEAIEAEDEEPEVEETEAEVEETEAEVEETEVEVEETEAEVEETEAEVEETEAEVEETEAEVEETEAEASETEAEAPETEAEATETEAEATETEAEVEETEAAKTEVEVSEEDETAPADGATYIYENMTFTSGDDGLMLTDGKNVSGAVDIPAYVNGIKVYRIAGGAFYNNTAITSVTIPNTVYRIGGDTYSSTGPFEGCLRLSKVTFEDMDPDTARLAWIGNAAFKGCAALTSVTIPANFDYIYWEAFRDCTSLTSLKINTGYFDHVSGYQEIYSEAFRGCTKLATVDMPSVSEVGSFAFAECSSLKTLNIPMLYQFDSGAFYKCTALTSVTLSNNSTKIGSTATNTTGVFEDCTRLTTVTITQRDSYAGKDGYIGNACFKGCTALTSIVIPSKIYTVYWDAFRDCKALKTVTYEGGYLSDTYQKIYSSAFENCIALTTFKSTDSLESIGAYAFYGDTSLTTVTLCKNLRWIGSGAFASCTALKTITIPNTVEELGGDTYNSTGVFEGDIRLATVTLTGYGTSEAWIGNNCFKGCSALTAIEIPRNYVRIYWNAFKDCAALKTVNLKGGFYSSPYQSINESAFQNCITLTTFKSTASLEEIGTFAFYGDKALTTVTLAEGLKWIGSGAFAGCTALKTITIPNTVEELGGDTYNSTGVFEGDTKLATVTLTGYGTSEAYIGTNCFRGCSALTAIEIPRNYVRIYWDAFRDCTVLKTVNLKGGFYGYPYQSINESAFENCVALTTFKSTASLEEIGPYAFYGDKALTTVTLAAGLKWIDSGAFAGCTALKTITIPKTVEGLGGDTYSSTGVFEGDTKLATVTLTGYGTSEAWIGNNCFKGCTALTNISIPKNYVRIYWDAFNGCTSLGKVTLKGGFYSFPYQVISSDAFYNCPQLYYLKVTESLDEMNGLTSLSDYPAQITLWGPVGSYAESYASDKGMRFNKKYSISKATFVQIAAQQPTGSQIKPALGTVKFYGNKIVSGTDYTINSYGVNKTAADDCYIEVKGKGDFTGTIKVKFCIAPKQPKITAVSNKIDGINVKWGAVNGATGYILYRKKAGATSWTKVIDTTSTSYLDTGRSNGVAYYYTVKAYKSRTNCITANSTRDSVGTGIYRVTRPSISSLTNSAAGAMTVTYSKNAKANGYQIQYSTTSDFSGTVKSIKITSPTTVTRKITSLTKGKTYYVRVRAYITDGTSTWYSSWSTVKSRKITN